MVGGLQDIFPADSNPVAQADIHLVRMTIDETDELPVAFDEKRGVFERWQTDELAGEIKRVVRSRCQGAVGKTKTADKAS